MNIIELVQKLLLDYPRISEVCNKIHIDFTDNQDTDYGLSSIGDVKLSEDILGNQTRQHNFVLYAVYQALNDYDRISNSGAILELQMYLESAALGQEVEITVNNTKYIGKLTKIECSNGMLYEIPLENLMCAWRYQLQINAQYEIERN